MTTSTVEIEPARLYTIKEIVKEFDVSSSILYNSKSIQWRRDANGRKALSGLDILALAEDRDWARRVYHPVPREWTEESLIHASDIVRVATVDRAEIGGKFVMLGGRFCRCFEYGGPQGSVHDVYRWGDVKEYYGHLIHSW